jgi:hypothetical protein
MLDAKIAERREIYEEAKRELQRLLTTRKVLVETLGVEAAQGNATDAFEDAAPAITPEAADRYEGILSLLKKRHKKGITREKLQAIDRYHALGWCDAELARKIHLSQGCTTTYRELLGLKANHRTGHRAYDDATFRIVSSQTPSAKAAS